MKIVVLNAGSGSQRCTLFDLPSGPLPSEPVEPVWQAKLDSTAPGQPEGRLVLQVRRGERDVDAGTIAVESSVADRTERLLRLLWEGPSAALTGHDILDAVAHRVVHGGTDFDRAVRVDAGVERAIERLAAMAPLHNPNNLTGIRVARAVLGEHLPAVAVFDTAFHRALPAAAATYAGPHAWLDQGIRRYGFHGTNYRWASARAAQLLGRERDPGLRLILCHLGGGCSLCATRGGCSIDTTMGFTPLDGIAMSTRSGAVDPGILLHLLRRGCSADELEAMLNHDSGLAGLSGLSGDTRRLRPEVERGNARATLAWEVFLHRLRAGIGAMLAALGEPPHGVVFTDAIGETEPPIRRAACAGFGFLGWEIDEARNADSPLDADIARPTSRARILIVKSREAWQIARECHALLGAR